MASIKLVLRLSQPKKDGSYPILIRVINERRVKYISTGYAVKEHQFREGQDNWVTRHPDAILINAALEVKRSEIAEQIYKSDIDHSFLDVDTLGNKKKKSGTFFTAFKIRLNTLEQRNQASMYHKLQSKLNILREAWGRDVYLADLKKEWADKYITYRLSHATKISTIKKDLTMFSGILKAIDYQGPDPFRKAQSGLKSDPINRDKLSLKEITLLERAKLSGLNDIARDMFLFSFYTHGMRFQNVATFDIRTVKNGLIRYRMNKGKKVREIEVHPKLQAIINKYKGGKPYLFPVVKKEVRTPWEKKSIIGSANALMNKHLKIVAGRCGIDKDVSMHIARHSFAYLNLQRGVSMEILKDALGHTNFAMTQQYLRSLSDEQVNQAVKGLYD